MILSIGIDDTDSRRGMCTTYLAYKIAAHITNDTRKKHNTTRFLDYPNLIRFNPNIPWKTRGNGAVCIKVKTDTPEQLKENVIEFLYRYSSDQKPDANPGVAFYEGEKIPASVRRFSEYSLCSFVKREYAKRFAKKHGIETPYCWGNGQGIVGAMGAIGYSFKDHDHTFELISYRKKENFGKARAVDPGSVENMQRSTYPYTFNSYDADKKRVLILPHGPDPVFFGIRGETAEHVIKASKMLQYHEKLDGYMVFRSNQGTGAHLKQRLDCNTMSPYCSGTVTGMVIGQPTIVAGGHVFFRIQPDNKQPSSTTATTRRQAIGYDVTKKHNNTVHCAVYFPTGITKVAAQLIPGDVIQIGGGIRKASGKYYRILNVEFIDIIKLNSLAVLQNPFCYNCKKTMKSKGKGQGFSCSSCGSKEQKKTKQALTRNLERKLYIPVASAHRHLTRPLQRVGIFNHYDPSEFLKKEEQEKKPSAYGKVHCWLAINGDN